MVGFIGRYEIVTHTNSCFLQMFLWENFSVVALKSMEYSEVTMEEMVSPDCSRRLRPSNNYRP